MIFSSHIFLFCFLPITMIGYFLLNKAKNNVFWQKFFLVTACLCFYGWFNIKYLPLILCSILCNYMLGRIFFLCRQKIYRKLFLIAGIIFNLGLLAYYKYADFFIENINAVFDLDIATRNLLLPLGISFFTFQQMSYLFDIYKGNFKEKYDFLTYSLFVTFFPQLIAGPIVMPNEMMPQFANPANLKLNWENMAKGWYIFAIGMAKKMIIADFFGRIAMVMFAPETPACLGTSWQAALAFTIQMYFDFSGYCDMAIGLGLMFNINLPVNFDAPHKAATIAEFWKRWHITLGRFLMTYVYFPLGGSRCSQGRKLLNTLITFTLCGIWHGAGWIFLIWGFLHGVALCIYNLWRDYSKYRLPKVVGIALTFLFLMLTGVLFSSTSITHSLHLYAGLLNFSPESLRLTFSDISLNTLTMYLFALGIIFFAPSAITMLRRFKPTIWNSVYIAVLILGSVLCMSQISPFLYFNF